jgi:hypothetical protein
MQSRRTTRAVPNTPSTRASSEPPIPAQSATRIKRATPPVEDLDESVQASLDAALEDLDRLELPDAAPRAPVAAPQRMPKGMPPLPFGPTLPSKMPPLPGASARGARKKPSR